MADLVTHYKLLIRHGFAAWPQKREDAVSGLPGGYKGRDPNFHGGKGNPSEEKK